MQVLLNLLFDVPPYYTGLCFQYMIRYMLRKKIKIEIKKKWTLKFSIWRRTVLQRALFLIYNNLLYVFFFKNLLNFQYSFDIDRHYIGLCFQYSILYNINLKNKKIKIKMNSYNFPIKSFDIFVGQSFNKQACVTILHRFKLIFSILKFKKNHINCFIFPYLIIIRDKVFMYAWRSCIVLK